MAESANLSELHTPLLDLIQHLAVTGKETARNFYNAPGWTLHHNTDIWATTNPGKWKPELGQLADGGVRGYRNTYGNISSLQATGNI